jgi:hypothetical protein
MESVISRIAREQSLFAQSHAEHALHVGLSVGMYNSMVEELREICGTFEKRLLEKDAKLTAFMGLNIHIMPDWDLPRRFTLCP